MLPLAASVAQGSSPPPLATGATGASGATGPGWPGAPRSASSSTCHTDAAPSNRYAIFASDDRAGRSAARSRCRSTSCSRSAAAAAASRSSGARGSAWVTSQRGIGIFTYSHEVTALPAPAAFRVLVRARWIGRGHRILRRLDALSPVCVQPLLEPDLAVTSISAGRHRSGGPSPGTSPCATSARPGGAVRGLAERRRQRARAGHRARSRRGASQVVQFTGPRCTAGGSLVATADSGDAITEPADSARTRDRHARPACAGGGVAPPLHLVST